MRLIKCYISSFGKLKDFSYEFKDNLNVVFEENGFGKSTFASFIKCMFYGVSDGKRSISSNERTKFKPWGSTEKFGGYLVFSTSKGEFRLERYFGNKSSEDEIKVYDNVSGKVIEVPENFANKLFGIDQDAFLSTLYFSENDLEVKPNSSLTAKYNESINVNSNEDTDKILETVKDAYKEYKYSGERGKIWDSARKISALEIQLSECEKTNEQLEILYKKEKQLSADLLILREEISLLSDKISIAGKAETINYKKGQIKALNQKLLSVENSISQLTLSLNGVEISRENLNSLEKISNDLQLIKDRITNLEQEILLISNQKEQKLSSSKSKFALPFTLLGVALALIGLVLSLYLSVYPLISISVIGLIVLCVGTLSFLKKPDVSLYDEQTSVKRIELENLNKTYNEYDSKLNDFLSVLLKGGNDYSSAISHINNAINEREKLTRYRSDILAEIESLSSDKDLELKVESDYGVDEIKASLERLNAQYAEKSDLLSKTKSDVKEMEKIVENVSVLESRLYEEKERKAKLDLEYQTLLNTYKILSDANENLKFRYKEPISKSFNKYLSVLTSGKKIAEIDTDFEVSVEEGGSRKDTAYYSKGYKNLFNFCRRFALIDVLFNNDKPFVILDDPFVNLDQEKLDSALKLVKEISCDFQVIYLVCHKSRTV